jgi:hypothetical protein
MRIFSQFACGLRVELSACSEKVSAPKTERAEAGRFNGEGGLSRHPVLSFIHAMCAWGNSTGRNSRSFRIKSTSSWSRRTESVGNARGLAQFGGKSGAHTPTTQAFQKHMICVL